MFDLYHLFQGSKTGLSRCQQEREEARAVARRPTVGIFIPSCNKDGTYAEIQCHAATGYCWCATKLGKPITGTSLSEKKPDCKGEFGSVRYIHVCVSVKRKTVSHYLSGKISAKRSVA